jgi:hypothetical protein
MILSGIRGNAKLALMTSFYGEKLDARALYRPNPITNTTNTAAAPTTINPNSPQINQATCFSC